MKPVNPFRIKLSGLKFAPLHKGLLYRVFVMIIKVELEA